MCEKHILVLCCFAVHPTDKTFFSLDLCQPRAAFKAPDESARGAGHRRGPRVHAHAEALRLVLRARLAGRTRTSEIELDRSFPIFAAGVFVRKVMMYWSNAQHVWS